MTATQGSVSSSNAAYLSAEEPELSSINFRQSLRFFQEQLVSSKGFRQASSTFCLNFQQEEPSKVEETSRSLSSSRISIPTVDTILESVRVLRAIQKSQQQRGSSWSLDLVQTIDDDPLEPQHSTVFKDFERIANEDIYSGLLTISSTDCDREQKEYTSSLDRVKNDNEHQHSSVVMDAERITSRELHSGLLTISESSGSDLDKSKENRAECSSNNQMTSFWPSNVVRHEVPDVITEIKKNVNDIQTDVELSSHSPSNVAPTYIADESNGSVDLELLQLVNDNFVTNQLIDTSESNNSRKDQVEENSSLLNSIAVPEKSDSETFQINVQDEVPQIKELYIETRHFDEDSEYFYVTENHPVQRKMWASEGIPIPCGRPESRSDTCSSIYVSAEGSPSFYSELDISMQVQEQIQTYSSQSANTESKKDIHFDPWTTDSSGIGTDLTNDSRTNESASSRSSTPIDNNILDDCLGTDKQTKEVSQTSCADIKPVEENITEETISSSEDSYIEATIKPSPFIEEHSVNIQCEYFNYKTNDDKPSSEENSAQIYSENSITKTDESKTDETSNKINVNTCDSNIEQANASEDIHKVHDIKKVKSNKIVDESEEHGRKKFTTSSWNLEAITESLYAIAEPKSLKVSSSSILANENDGISPNVRLSSESSFRDNGSTESVLLEENTTTQTVFVLNEGIFVQYSPGHYILQLQEHRLQIKEETNTLISIPLTYAEVTRLPNNVLKVDNRLGKCLFFKTDTQKELTELFQLLQFHSSRVWTSEPLQLVHYPMKCHKNVVIVDLGSCSTRAGILMDQPTLPFLFFPSICATDRKTGNHVYGKEALQSKVRQNSSLSFPLRPSVKIIKHSIDIDLIGGLFKMIFQELRVDPTQYAVQVCLPRTLSISSQDAIVKLLLEDLKVEAVSLTHQALLTLYAHKASTGIVVDIGDRMDILPVVDGFIVDGGVTRLTYGGQRLIHHMKHALAQKHISLSNDIDSFVVQYISENLSYVAEDYDSEVQIASKYPDMVKKTIALSTFAKDDKCAQSATLDDARFKTPEGLFQPELWGLDSPGIHKLVHKAIHATGVDVRKKIAEHIYVSGGVTMIPGFVERLLKEVSDLNKPKIVPKVIASNYRYHCTYIGACEFAKMDVFPKVCVNLKEYSKSQTSSLKKFALCF